MALLGRKAKVDVAATAEAAAQPEPETVAIVEAHLATLDAERRELHAAIDAHPAREAALFEAGADDEAFRVLDRDKRRAQWRLGKLDAEEAALVARARALHEAERQAAFAEAASEYIALARRVVEAGREAARLERELQDAYNTFGRQGFGACGVPTVPTLLPLPLATWRLDTFAQTVERFVPVLPPAPAAAQLHTVRFRKAAGVPFQGAVRGYSRGDEAGFDPGTAWGLVDLGMAEWVGRPPRRPDLDIPAAPDPRWAQMFGNGPAADAERHNVYQRQIPNAAEPLAELPPEAPRTWTRHVLPTGGV